MPESVPPRAEVVAAYPVSIAPVRNVRSTLIMGAIASITKAGYYDAWYAGIPPQARGELLQMVAGVWVPVGTALAHYRACDSLGLSPDAEAKLGAATLERVRGTLLGTMLRVANTAGVTPWTLLAQLQRFWNRAFDGGGIQVLRLGPKEARADLVQNVLTETHYHRNALRGLLASVLQLFCQKAYVNERRGPREPGTMSTRVQWV